MTTGDSLVRAAGGLVWRRSGDGRLEVLVVHRPRYDDWSLPKGKAEPDESDLACAIREVEEETGLRCTPGDELPTVYYVDRHDRPKRVRYWAMTPDDGSFEAGDEVDAVEWIPEDVAGSRLTYERDRDVVARFASHVSGGRQ